MHEIILFIYSYGHFLLILLVVLKAVNIFSSTKKMSFVFRDYFLLYNNAEVREAFLNKRHSIVFHNVSSYIIQLCFFVWITSICLVKFFMLLYHLQHSQ